MPSLSAFFRRRCLLFLQAAIFLLLLATPSTRAGGQDLSKRLILKDGTYQLATKWEVQGDRVKFYSAERSDWEELPNSLVDWNATNQFEKERKAGIPAPEAVALDKEIADERAADESRQPEVASGLRLPEDGSILLLDTFDNQPQLVELQQNGGEVDRNTKTNMLRAAINPIAGAKQTIQLEGPHAQVQAHTLVPSIYVNLAQNPAENTNANMAQPQQPEKPQQPMDEWDRFRIVRAESKKGMRVIGQIKINPLGKSSQQTNLIATTSVKITGGWIKVTPDKPLNPGEYAVVESMGREGINLFVWDFGVNSSAAANGSVIKPGPASESDPAKPAGMQPKR